MYEKMIRTICRGSYYSSLGSINCISITRQLQTQNRILETGVHEHVSKVNFSFQNGNTINNLAHIINGGIIPLENKTVGQLLEEAVQKWTDRESIISIDTNERLTYSELMKRVDRFAAGLNLLGMRRGERIGVWGPNDIEWYISFLAAARIGLITVGINPAYQLSELIYSLNKVGVKTVICPNAFKTQSYSYMLLNAKKSCPTLEHVIVWSQDHVRGTRRFCDIESVANKLMVEEIRFINKDISCHDGCNIQFTSGTTGNPKAALLSHKSLVNNSKQAAKRADMDKTHHKICLNVPFFHAFGMVMGQLASLHGGCTIVLESRSFDPIQSLTAVAREKCSIMYGTPTMWTNVIRTQQELNLPIESLCYGVMGGSPASPNLFKRIREILRFDNIKSIYGLTEATAVIFQSLFNENWSFSETTVGYVADHVEAKVVNENGSTVPLGNPGELWVRGYCNMIGYWDDEENTKKTITEDGWLKTGDRFILHSNGYGQIIGRFKDMIIRGGENIFPKEIEDFLMTHPEILEVQVIGAYDEINGEEICACVRINENGQLTEEKVKNFCRGKIAHFKIPRYVQFVDEYPKTVSGKIQKFVLRRILEEKGTIPTNPEE